MAIDGPMPDPPRSLDKQVAAVRGAFDRFHDVLDAVTVTYAAACALHPGIIMCHGESCHVVSG